jgi:ferredoxin
MTIKKVWVDPGCIICHLSEDTCPEVFHVGPEGASVKPGADFVKHDALIREAAEGCPVTVIKFEE